MKQRKIHFDFSPLTDEELSKVNDLKIGELDRIRDILGQDLYRKIQEIYVEGMVKNFIENKKCSKNN